MKHKSSIRSLSIVLAVLMLMSVFSVISASADDVVIDNLPVVKFDAGSGTTPVEQEQVNSKYTLDFLPRATRSGYTFAGWYMNDGADVSEQVYASATTFRQDATVYARWVEANPPEVIKGFYFEDNLDAQGWTFKTEGEGNGWTQEVSTDYISDENSRDSKEIPEGEGIIGSYSAEFTDKISHVEKKNLNVENWAISPAIKVPDSGATVSLWAKSSTWMAEDFRICAGFSAETSEMRPITAECRAEFGAVTPVAGISNYQQFTADLDADFAGRTVYIAIRHTVSQRNEDDLLNLNNVPELLVDMMEVYGVAEKYPIWIKGIQVNDANKDDVLGDGVFKYDSDTNTLHVNGDCDAESNHAIKSEMQDLTISVDGDSELTSDTTAVWLEKDTVITGDGTLDVVADGSIGINVEGQPGAITTLKIDEATVNVSGQIWGITGNQNICALEINDSDVTADSSTPPNHAMGGFSGGINLTDCEVITPDDTTFQNGDTVVKDGDGNNADYVVIGKNNAGSSDANTSEASSDANTSEESSDANTSETSSDANTSEESSDANTSETSSDANTSEESSDANTSEESSDDNTSEAASPDKSESSAPAKSESSGTEPKPGPETSAPKVEKGATEAKADKAITSAKTEKDAKGSKFGLLCLRQKTVAKTYLTVRWNKVKGAKYYVVYGAKCGKTKTGFTPFKKLKRVGKSKTTYTQKKLKKGTYYKYIVVALNSKKKVITTSKNIHICTTGGKKGNDKTVKVNKSTVKLNTKKKKTFTIKASPVLQNKKRKVMRHRTIKFECTNTKIAKVTQKGKITAKKKGTCYIYVYAQNGLYKKVKVVVK